MPICKEYKIDIPAGSVVYDLYKDLKSRYGMTDEEIDRNGYQRVDYSNPAGRPLTVGASDCSVLSEDVVDLLLRDLKKYQPLLESRLNVPFPCSLDDLDPATTFDTEIRSKLNDAKSLIGSMLLKQGHVPGSDDYKKRMAVAIVCYFGMPSTDVLQNLPDERKDQILNRMTALDELGMGDYKKILLANGGMGMSLGRYYSSVNISALTSIRTGHRRQVAYYAVLDLAGVEPFFVESPPAAPHFSSETGTYSYIPIPTNVGVKLTDGVMVFNIFDDTKPLFSTDERTFLMPLRNALQWYLLLFGEKHIESVRSIGLHFAPYSVLMQASDIEYSDGNTKRAVSLLEGVISINPGFFYAYLKLSQIATESGHYGSALGYLDAALKNCSLTDAERGIVYYQKATALGQSKKYAEAIENLSKASELNHDLANHTKAILALIHFTKGEYEKCAQVSQEVAANLKYAAGPYSILAMAYIKQEKWDLALGACQKLAGMGALAASAYLSALVYYHQNRPGEMEKALSDYNKTIMDALKKLQASKGQLKRLVSEAYPMMTNPALGIPAGFKKAAVEKVPLIINLFAQYAFFHYMEGNSKDAVSILNETLEWAPQHQQSLLHSLLSEIYEGEGDIEKAGEHWQKYLNNKEGASK